MKPPNLRAQPIARLTLRLAALAVLLGTVGLGYVGSRPDTTIGQWLRTGHGLGRMAAHPPALGTRKSAAADAAPWPITAPPLVFSPLTPAQAGALNDSIPVSTSPIEPARPLKLLAADPDAPAAVQCLTQAIYYEAGFEPRDGQEAVAQVVLNRVRHPLFPKSVCGVVYQGSSLSTGCQFTFTCDGSLDRTPDPSAWARAKGVAEKALSGFVMPRVGTATHYHAQYVVPFWINSLVKLTRIGGHIFYRWPGAAGHLTAFNGRYSGPEVDPRFAVPKTDLTPTIVTVQPPSMAAIVAPSSETILPAQASVELATPPAVVLPTLTAAPEVERNTAAPPAPVLMDREVPAIVRNTAPCLNPMAGCGGW